MFLVEGPASVEAALSDPRSRIMELLVSPNLLGREHAAIKQARDAGIDVVEMTRDCFKKVSDTKAPQGLAATVRIPSARPELLRQPEALVVVCCGIADPGNLGTIIRTADAVAATCVVTLPPSADLYNAKVVRSTAASLFHVPCFAMSEEAFLDTAREVPLRLVAAAAHDGEAPSAATWQRPFALAIGSEAHGVPESILSATQTWVTLPLPGRAESLNAAVAAGILLYESVRP
jgi:TrmH family RNA methyltransferase